MLPKTPVIITGFLLEKPDYFCTENEVLHPLLKIKPVQLNAFNKLLYEGLEPFYMVEVTDTHIEDYLIKLKPGNLLAVTGFLSQDNLVKSATIKVLQK